MPVDFDQARAARRPVTFRELVQRGDLDRRTAQTLERRGLHDIQAAACLARPELEMLPYIGPAASAKVARLAERHGLTMPAPRWTCPETGRRINQGEALRLRLRELGIPA